jgi:hypothetical protein
MLLLWTNCPAVTAAFDRNFSARMLDPGVLCNAAVAKVGDSREARRRHVLLD